MKRVDPRRQLPSVDAVLRAARPPDADRERFARAARDVLARARASGATGDAAAFAAEARALLDERARRTLRRVLNATGVILQTNLGRAPLSARALAAIAEAAGAVSVEFDLAAGKRGERHGHAARLLAELAGAEDACVVNNNAAAVLLALAALATRKEVIVARGELVEIGGGFRIPDVLRRSGAKLVEVGTTNRTYARDYAAAITERTGAILRVHASNFKQTGFVARADGRDLAALAREHNVAYINDLGSGTLLDTAKYGLPPEETVAGAVGEGADVVTFSGDKLLGGPQAGLCVGRGSLPDETQPSFAVALSGPHVTRLAATLRRADPPVIARIVDERVALDLRSVLPEDDELLARVVETALEEGGADGSSQHPDRPSPGAGRSV